MMTENNLDEEIPVNSPSIEQREDFGKVVYFAVGPQSNEIKCPFCEEVGKTIVSRKIDSWENVNTYLACLLCWCPIVVISCLAYCIPCYKNCQHFCSKCGEYLGTYRRPKI